jgi:multicomponent Na+:H+ antiporter subunit D
MQLLIFAMLAFVVLVRLKLYPPEIPSVVLNSDWFYRRLAPKAGLPLLRMVMLVWGSFLCQMRGYINAIWDVLDRIMHSPLTGPTVSGRAVLIQAGLLMLLLLIAYAAAG